MSLDPVDDCTFWYTQEYLQFDGAFNWFTHISSFKFPTCGVVVAAPTVTSVSPIAGPTTGGNTVTINGTNFVSGASVKFGATASALVTFVSATQLKAVAPAHAAGTVDVTVTTPGGTSAIVAGDHYAYGPPTVSSFTPTSGITGSSVTINGTGFAPGAIVKFGLKASTVVTFVSGTQIKATVPNGAITGKISVTTAAGTGTSASNFTVTLSITGFSPTTGPAGTVVTITGIGFNSSSIVKFNGTAASSVIHVSSTQLKATVPSTATTGPITVTNTTAPTGTVRSGANYTKT
jgi:IPT/TIG domain